MPADHDTVAPRGRELRLRVFSGLFGSLFGLALVKFGNPVLLANLVERPADVYQWLFFAWPIPLSFGLLGVVAIVGLFCVGWPRGRLCWVAALPAVWLAWQFVAASRTVSPELTRLTIKQLAACTACFYLGFFCLSRVRNLSLFWGSVFAGFVIVLAAGWDQHFGGLTETRRQFDLYVAPQMKEVPPELLKRMHSERIFSTLFYPNTLAGALLLFLPAILVFVWRGWTAFTPGARLFLVAVVAVAGLACLYWSGSKGGWLLMLLLGIVALLHSGAAGKWKALVVAVLILAGLAGFVWRYAGFFQRGATSVVARFDYWRAAVATAKASPVFGTGPGTFSLAYQRIKPPEAEMSRLVHNDYLQQASDSGLPGFLAYGAFVIGGLAFTRFRAWPTEDPLRLAVWLGLLGWALHSTFEFGLYIPALGWPAFGLMGWLLGLAPNRIDKPGSSG
jgi:hypothetical protein